MIRRSIYLSTSGKTLLSAKHSYNPKSSVYDLQWTNNDKVNQLCRCIYNTHKMWHLQLVHSKYFFFKMFFFSFEAFLTWYKTIFQNTCRYCTFIVKIVIINLFIAEDRKREVNHFLGLFITSSCDFLRLCAFNFYLEWSSF